MLSPKWNLAWNEHSWDINNKFEDGQADGSFCTFCPSAPGRGTAALTLTLLGNKVLPALSLPPFNSALIWELLKWSCHSGLLGDLSAQHWAFSFWWVSLQPLEREVRATVVSLSTGILNSNETPNRSIKAGARGSNPTQIWVKFVFYLFFFSPSPLF